MTVTSQTASKLSIKFNSLLDFASNDTFVVWAQVQNVFKVSHLPNFLSELKAKKAYIYYLLTSSMWCHCYLCVFVDLYLPGTRKKINNNNNKGASLL